MKFVLLAVSVAVPIILFKLGFLDSPLGEIDKYPLLAAVLGGGLFVSTFTAATGAIMLLSLLGRIDTLTLIILAGVGAVASDLLMFDFIKDGADKIEGKRLKRLFHTKYLRWILPIIGALIIASPLPDELGVGLLEISSMSKRRFILLSFVLNSIGIAGLLAAANLLTP